MAGEDKPVLIALHGWGARGSFFFDLAKRLEPHCDVIAPDLCGHGEHMGAPGVSLDSMARELAVLLDSQKGRVCFLLGWSMGAAVAFAYLDRFGTRAISGLIIEDMSPKPLNDESWSHGLRNGYRLEDVSGTLAQIETGWGEYGRRVWRATFADIETARRFEDDPLYGAFLDNEEGALASSWESLMALDARALVSDLSLPVLALMGAKSHVYSKSLGRWYQQVLKKGEVVFVEGAGHAPHLEKSDLFASKVAAFIQRHR